MYSSTSNNPASLMAPGNSARTVTSPAIGSSATTNIENSQSTSSPATPSSPYKVLHVYTDSSYSKKDFLIDPTHFPGVQPGDLFEIYDPALPADTSKKLIIQWTGPDRETPNHVQVDPSQYVAKYVELTFRDQYIGRSDMWRLRTSLLGTSVYESKKILYLGCLRAQVKEIYVGNQSVPSGYITSETRIIFRSESAKYFIFIQMSKEMWEFDEDGEIFFEKVIFGFLPNLFARWRGKRDGKLELDLPTNHVVSIVLFSRIFYQKEEEERFQKFGYPGGFSGLQKSEDGRYFQDFYKVVIDWEARTDWTTAIIPLKEEIMRYQRDILLRPAGQYSILSGENSFAFEGNVLESINLALNSLDKHYVDRDLQRTGLSIVMITPGSGAFDVDKKLLRLTTERMISSGIGLDMICLSKMPAHIVPLFRWRASVADSNGVIQTNQSSSHSPSNFNPNIAGGTLMVRTASTVSRPNSRPPSIKESSAEGKSATPWARNLKPSSSNPQPEVLFDMSDPLYYDAPTGFATSTKEYYLMPHWVDCMFYIASLKNNTQKFYTRCKMYELQMMGIMEHEISSISIPYLNEVHNSQQPSSYGKRLSSTDALITKSHPAKTIDLERHDDEVFYDPNSPLASEIKQLNLSSGHGSRVVAKDPFISDTADPMSSRNLSSGRRYDGYLTGAGHQNASTHNKATGELSRSLPRVWGHTSVMQSNIPENQSFRDLPAAPGRVSFSLKSASGHLEENRAIKQSDRCNMDDLDSQGDLYDQNGVHDDSMGEQTNYGGIAAQNYVNIKSKTGHNRSSTDDDPGFLSSSTVKPIYISQNLRGYQDDGAPSEVSAADSCNTGSISSDKGTKNYISNPSGHGGRIIQTRQRSKQTLINPCNPPKTVIRMTSQLRRWQHAFPRVKGRCSSPDLIRSEVYTDGLSNTEAWKGLMSPASLPLTTDYFPSKEELQELYSEYNHTISPSDDSRSDSDNDQQRYNRTKNLMKELIYHRLAQGFQLIVERSSSTSKVAKPDVSGILTENGGSTETNGSMAKNKGTDTNANHTVGLDFPSKNPGITNGIISNNRTKGKSYYLSMGQHVHRLSIDSNAENIEVKRYERRFGYKAENINYQCVIWAKQLPGYMPRELTFTYPMLSHYQWNYLDHLVSGYQEGLTEELLYWRARFILIPVEHFSMNNFPSLAGEQLDEEEMRLVGFQRFLDLFQKARYVDSKNDKSAASRKQESTVKVQPVTCSVASWGFTELARMENESPSVPSSSVSVAPEPEKLGRKSKLQTIATAIQNPLTGIKFQNRRWHKEVHTNAFPGNDVVDWLICNFVDIDTREEATEFGKSLFERGLFVHCLGKHHFMDGHYFYQFSPEYAPAKQPKSWLRQTATSLTRRDVDLDKILNKEKDQEQSPEKLARPPIKMNTSSAGSTTTLTSIAGATTGAMIGGSSSSQPTNGGVPSFLERLEMMQKSAPKKIEMSKSMTIDMDPNKRSDRRETAFLHYDVVHNIKYCYHFQLHWLGCTARLIEDMLQTWGRTAERNGLRLIEAPIDQDSQGRAFNPFESPIPIKLALRPPPTRGFYEANPSEDPSIEPLEVPKLHFFTEFVKLHGFVLDMESDELYPPPAQLIYSYKRAPYRNIQYVHRSGVAFIQISYDGPYEFLWVNNRLLTSHSIPSPERDRSDWDRSGQEGGGGGGGSSSKNASSNVPHPDVLRKKFTATCANVEELAKIWNDISSHLNTISGIHDILEDVPDQKVVEREGLEMALSSPEEPDSQPEMQDTISIHGTPGMHENEKLNGNEADGNFTTMVDVPTIRIEMDSVSPVEEADSAQS
ncbi:vacuolar membrane-associated protein iml1 [Entomortierella beljakovae]|nr:vacuolar membrane-associated protein iml1 [Entomortierella beljakovae]